MLVSGDASLSDLMVTVHINKRAAQRIDAGHVWVYASDVEDRGEAQPGDVVSVADGRGRTLGTAFYSSTSEITLRFVSRDRVTVDAEFIAARIHAAAEHRRWLVDDSTAFRAVFSEADLLPGLIVDRYGDWLSVQLLTQAIDRRSEEILSALAAEWQPAGVVLRNDAPSRSREGLGREVRVVSGEGADSVAFEMNGFRWTADLKGGQKTGTFLDQRENYLAAARYARGQALDCFSSSGGFALHLSRCCESVEGIDASAAAVARAMANASQNAIGNVRFREADVFDVLASMAAQRRGFGTIVLDPPAFAKSRSAVAKALSGYKEINAKALRLLAPGGVLVTCSCSQHVGEDAFLEMLAAAAHDARRNLRILERRTQASDHPILLTVPESQYLKCVIAQTVD